SRKTSRDRPCHPARQPSVTLTPTRITRPTRDCLGPNMWERCINNREARGEGRHFLVGRHLMATAVDTATTAPSIPKQTSRTRAATALYACRICPPPSWQLRASPQLAGSARRKWLVHGLCSSIQGFCPGLPSGPASRWHRYLRLGVSAPVSAKGLPSSSSC